MSAIEVKVPDIGDFKNVPVIEIPVKPGDVVKLDDPLIVLESDKASMEVPSPAAGKVLEILVKMGDKVSEGSLILKLEAEGAAAGPRRPPGGGSGAVRAAGRPRSSRSLQAPRSTPASSAARRRLSVRRIIRRWRAISPMSTPPRRCAASRANSTST